MSGKRVEKVNAKEMEIGEYILCAAIWYQDGEKHESQPTNIETGFVVAGRRHHNCYSTVSIIASIDETVKLKIENVQKRMTDQDWRNHQGFITSRDRYVNRYEAFDIAEKANQIKFGYEASKSTRMLISENLY